MRTTVLILTCLTIATSCANRNVYKSRDFENEAATHRTIAILPVKITETGHVAKNVNPEDIRAANERWAYIFQESLHSYVLRETGRNRKGPVVSFQGLQKTNAILKENNLTTMEAISSMQPEALAKMLKVDAVMITTLDKQKNFSDGVAYGLAAGRAVLGIFGQAGASNMLWMNASEINMNCALYDAGDSRVLWKTFRQGGTDLPKNVDDLVEYYSSWIAKKLPYRS